MGESLKYKYYFFRRLILPCEMSSRKTFVIDPVVTGMTKPSSHLGFSGPIKSTLSGFHNTFQSSLIEHTYSSTSINFNSPLPKSMSFAPKPYGDAGRYVTGNSLPNSMPPFARW